MEVECKLAVQEAELGSLRERIGAAGRSHRAPAVQVDTYFTHPARDMAATDEAFRLRDAGVLELTYKGPRARSDVKARPEINLEVANDPLPLLAALGFRATARLVKRRESWHVGDCEVTLDHVEGLGWFVEIEAGHEASEPEAAIDSVRATLGLDDRPHVARSYLGMALQRGAAGVTVL